MEEKQRKRNPMINCAFFQHLLILSYKNKFIKPNPIQQIDMVN